MIIEVDKAMLAKKGLTQEELENQLRCFEKGFPFLEIVSAASVEKGILRVSDGLCDRYLNVWNLYRQSPRKKIAKFVPASGAASRMFKDLFEFLSAAYDVPTTGFEKSFFDNIAKFAFYADLDEVCQRKENCSIADLLSAGRCKAVVKWLLDSEGLNYGGLPKGLLKFHLYSDGARTAAEEHLKEGLLYALNADGVVNIHFTVSPEHQPLFEKLMDEKVSQLEKAFSVNCNIGFSVQKASTDTVAADADNKPFRENGEMVFRPGGHGALIENLNDLDADVVFIKNIDNVVPDRLKAQEARCKELIAGVLVDVQSKVFGYLELIDSGRYTHDELMDILHFLQHVLNVKNPETKFLEDAELVLYLKRKFDRPCRVCGMVRNVGEPGGGPFLAVNTDGTVSPQILESSQINMANAHDKEMFHNGTHFNPVDLVCGIKDYRGQKFDLRNYVDSNTGFISIKSKNGRELKALELPGLWNGAMSDWNTIFVEVPIETFNPVKTVNDLLRNQHLT